MSNSERLAEGCRRLELTPIDVDGVGERLKRVEAYTYWKDELETLHVHGDVQ